MHPQRVAIRFPGTHDGFAQAFDRFREALDAEEMTGTARFNTELVFEEMIANIISHGAKAGRELAVAVTLEAHADSIVLTFEDDGVPFDPCAYTPPVRTNLLDETQIGGFGLILVRHAAKSIDYVRTVAGQNRVSVTLSRLDAAQ